MQARATPFSAMTLVGKGCQCPPPLRKNLGGYHGGHGTMPPVRRSMRSKPIGHKPCADPSEGAEESARQSAGQIVAMSSFPYHLPYKQLDLRKTPHLYRPGRGEQGVLTVEPYKSELLPHWAFKTPAIAIQSSQALEKAFHAYVDEDDFVGADMARKFIQMGFTRSRRYANHKGGRKYVPEQDLQLKQQKPRVHDPIKAESAQIFHNVLERVKANEDYARLRIQFQDKYKNVPV